MWFRLRGYGVRGSNPWFVFAVLKWRVKPVFWQANLAAERRHTAEVEVGHRDYERIETRLKVTSVGLFVLIDVLASRMQLGVLKLKS